MKASNNTLESLADIQAVKTSGDVRRIGSQMLLALARKEVSALDLIAASKMLEAQAGHLNAELKVAKFAADLRKQGGQIVKTIAMGRLQIGTPEED